MAGKTLITGATGTVGTELSRALAGKGADVRVGVRPSKKPRLFPDEFEQVVLDHDQPETYADALRGVSRLFLLLPSTHDQVEIAQRLVSAAKEAGVEHVVKLSAMRISSDILFNRWHRQAEEYLEASGIAWTHLCPTSFMQNFIVYDGASITSDGKIYQPMGEGRVAYVDARDIAAVAAKVLVDDTSAHAGKSYDLTGPASITVGEVASAITRAIGRQVVYVDVPEEATRSALLSYNAPSWLVEGTMELYAVSKAGHASRTTDWVETITGRAPYDIDNFARTFAPSWNF